MPLYFGYGSNLDRQDWERFCGVQGFAPDVLRPVGPGWLPDHELVFHYFSKGRNGGALNIRPAVGKAVSGWLYEVAPEGWAVLDRKESVGTSYRRLDCTVLGADGEEIAAQTYDVLAHRIGGFTPPHAAYLEICRRGRAALGLDATELEAAATDKAVPARDSLFVYGTLMRGEIRFHYIHAGAPTALLLASVKGRLYDHGDYPGLALGGEGRVHGELVRTEATATLMPVLDKVELFRGFGNPDNLYRRTLIPVEADEATPRRAWTYVMQKNGERLIDSGSWRIHRGRREAVLEAIARRHLDHAPGLVTGLPPALGLVSASAVIAALGTGRLSERVLAEASGCWNAMPE